MQFEKTFARLTFEDRRTDRMTRGVEKQEIAGSEESDHLEYAGDFFHLAH